MKTEKVICPFCGHETNTGMKCTCGPSMERIRNDIFYPDQVDNYHQLFKVVFWPTIMPGYKLLDAVCKLFWGYNI